MSRLVALRLLLVALAVSAAACLAGCGGAQSRFASHLERGKQYLAQGNLEKASVELRNSLQIRPKAPDALFLSGQVSERRGDIRGALGLYQAAIDVQPDLTQARASLGMIYVMARVPDKALQLVEPYLAKHPDVAELLLVRGAARAAKKDLAGARADAERAIKLDSRNERAIGLLAGIDRNSGDLAGGISLVSDAIHRLPASAGLHEVLAGLYFAAKKSEQGQEQLRKLIELRPSEPRYRYQLAAALLHDHQVDAAQRALEDGVKALPDSDALKLALVDFVSSQRSPAAAAKLLRDFVDRNPRDNNLRIGLGALYERQGAAKDALNTYSEVAKRDGEHAQGLLARNRMAAVEVSQGHLDAALKLVKEVLKKSPRDSEALAIRGGIEAERNDTTAAIADLRAAVRDRPRAVGLQQTLARVYLASGQPALAEEVLRNAAELAPRNPQVHLELAEVLARNNNPEQAVAVLEQTARDAPTDLRAREALVRAYMAKHDLPAARKAAEDIKTLRPDAATGFYLVGLIAQAEGKLDEGEKELEHALTLQPSAIDALLALATLYERQGRVDDAIAKLDATYKRNPKLQAVANNLAMLLATYKTDQADLDRAKELTASFANATDPNLLDTHGWVSFKRGEYADALPVLERALERKPDSGEIRYHAAMAELRAGQRDRARDNLQSALAGSGKFVGSDEARAVLASLKSSAG